MAVGGQIKEGKVMGKCWESENENSKERVTPKATCFQMEAIW